MKKYISSMLVLFGILALTACTEDEGTTPGSDSQPLATVYSYEVKAPLNPDNDVNVRFVFNNKVNEAYYFAEKTADKEARNLTEEGYADYVIANGTKLATEEDLQSGGHLADVILKDLYGEYTITAVAISGNTKKSASTTFTGLDWADVAEGTYYFGVPRIANLVAASVTTTLQVCTTDETLYRFKNLFGVGYSMKIKLLPRLTNTDSDGTYTYFRIPSQATGLVYAGYDVSIRDIGYWQGDDAYVTDGGYESGIYEDGFCFISAQYYVSAGNVGVANSRIRYDYDYFVPSN